MVDLYSGQKITVKADIWVRSRCYLLYWLAFIFFTFSIDMVKFECFVFGSSITAEMVS